MHCDLALTLKAQGHILFSVVDYVGTRIKTMLEPQILKIKT